MDHFVVEHSDYPADTPEYKFLEKIGKNVAKHFHETCFGWCRKTKYGTDFKFGLPNQDVKPVVYGYQTLDIEQAMFDENKINEASNAFIETLIDRITHK